ncbi:hypothetical protein B0T18DRAFT_472524 [Schizothecium vesticola]|uniref:Aldehyde dehydrogenase domain-containing protein n=1 Tax=Schizothecium vesticola TaxID=314040 RepID=A0AA40EKP2_9PEZI|nr:hypothetical protein B0T18DRAFT_472524 [Schizothecium vesticola]
MDLLLPSLVDARADHPRHMQSQLAALHRALASPPHASRLCRSLVTLAPAEAEAELALALNVVRHWYDSVDVARAHDDEYAVARGRSCPRRRVAAGLVVVRRGAGVFGVVAAVAAAHGRGGGWGGAARGGGGGPGRGERRGPARRELVSAARTRAVAVVDRTADVEAAARAIVRARFGFAGQSPYAPDLVLVNEYVKKDFFEACTRFATGVFAARGGSGEREEEKEVRRVIAEAEGRKEVVSFGSDAFKLVEVLDRSTPLLKAKITGRYLPIAICSSLVDAVFSQEFENPLLAGYFFASNDSAKYLSQFLPCHLSAINHIPTQLLVGPAASLAHASDPLYRYNPDMFTEPRPQFVPPTAPPTATLRAVEEVLELKVKGGGAPANLQKLRTLAAKPLRPTGQPETLVGLDYFLSGLLVGTGVVVAGVVTGVVLGRRAWGGWRQGG